MIRPFLGIWRCGLLLLLALMSAPLLALAAEDPPTEAHNSASDSRPRQVDALFAAWDKPGSPGCATGVMSQGRLVYAKGYGLADLDSGTPLSPDTVFDVASMAKQFTAANVALLTLDHRLALKDDVRARFPEVHVNVPVTIENLLHHTSGLRDYAELNQLRGIEPTDNSGVIALLARQKTLNFAPGSQHAYSNSNYVLLAELIQRLTGGSLAALSQQRIFAPLDMQSTRFAGDLENDPTNLAKSYAPIAPGQFAAIARNTQSVGDGNLLTTVRDLARWDENFYTNRVGGKALEQMMRTPATLTDGKQVPYGLGLMFDRYRGVPTEHHGGSFHGFRTELLRFPQQHFSVSVLCNVASANASALASHIADIYLADVLQPRATPATAPVDAKIDPEKLETYTGDYLIDFNGPLIVVHFGRRGNQLFLQSAFEAPNEMIPVSDTELREKNGRGRISFEASKGGSGTKLTLRSDDGDFVGQRITAQGVSSELADKLTGVYYSDEADAEFRLQIVDEQVIVDAGHNRKFPVLQLSEARFAMPGGATLDIERGRDGQISGLVFSSSRVANLRFARRAP